MAESRRKKRKQALSSCSKLENDINDDLLVEILVRLPNCRYAIRCRAVCKRWNSLISSPEFVQSFVTHHQHHHTRVSHGLWFQYPQEVRGFHAFGLHAYQVYFTKSKTHHPSRFLDFLPPTLSLRPGPDFRLLCSCKDLLLVRATQNYLICNPFTRQWVRLPDPPPRRAFMHGVACERGSGRYRVVLVGRTGQRQHPAEFSVGIFSSDTGEWSESQVSSPRVLGEPNRLLTPAGVVACDDGTLYWLDERDRQVQGVVAFNPFDDEISPRRRRCRFIDLQAGFGRSLYWLPSWSYSLGSCRGRLRVATVDTRPGLISLTVWELLDHDMNNNNNKDSNAADSPWCVRYRVRYGCHQRPFRVVGFHPNKDDVFYIVVGKSVLRYRIGRPYSNCTVVGEFPDPVEQLSRPLYLPDAIEQLSRYLCFISAFPLVASTWPTTVSPRTPPS